MQLIKKSISIVVSFNLIVSQCLYAADLPIAIDTTAAAKNQATLDKAPNGVQIVNIVNPNSSGMSHNKFKEYNVNPSGLILNNSTNVTNTQLAGYISFNPNLSSNAKVILNEVTGTNKSLLKGYTEVAGNKADVIVANPNGIAVNGGGFINTNKATLTTGSVSYLNGLVNGFDISKGQILIEGDGFNVNNIDKVELYSKALEVNAKFYANNLKVATGENSVTLDGKVTSKNKVDSGVSIDSSLLGGIYANTISLVSSDKGVGVNLPPEVSAQDSLTLSASGDITLSKIEANNTIEISSTDGNINSNSTLSADTLNLKAKETLTNNSSMEGNNVSIEAKTLENKNNVYAKNDVDIKTENLNNSGLIQADDDINITTTNLTNKIDSTIYAKNDSNIIAEQLSNDGLFVSENLNINAKNINNKGAFYTTKDMSVKTENLTNLEMIRSNSKIDLLVSNELINDVNGVIYADGNVNISANEQKDKINTVINKGLIQSETDINITVKKLENTATAPTYKNTTTSSSQTVSRGGSNDYDIVNTTTVTQSIDIPSDPALILAGGDISIDVDTLNNFYSLIASDGNIVLNANQANNVGKILVSTTTTVTNQYRDEKYCSSSGPSGVCFNHKNRAAYRGSFTTTQTTKLPVPNYGIQAKRNITGNVVNLSNTNGSAQDILTNQQITEKQDIASTIQANAISLQKLTDQLDTNNETKTSALGTVPDMNALVDSILTEEDFTSFKTDLANLEDSIQTSIDQDKLDIASIEAIITYTKTLTMSNSLSTEIVDLELALQALKDNVTLNETNIATFKSINESILTIEDINTNKNALLDIDSSVRSVVSDNSTLITNLTTNDLINTIVLELENISDFLYAEVKKSLDLQVATTQTSLSSQEGLYQTNSNNSLQNVNNVSYDNKVLTSDDVINFNVLLPSGKYGLFVLNKSQNHPYLIESNPLYTSYAKFIGSDYMLGKLSYKPENTIQRLGDGLYETNLVRDSIIKLTGQRYLDGFSSDVSQFQALMDNALSLQEGLNLSYGVSLSKEQVAQLNKDIVWMEERIVNNQKVLVPIVYLATINQENMIDGTKITAGENITITAQNNVLNQGLISSNNNTNIQATNITNQGGTINSNQNISLNASNNIDNISGNIKAANNIELNAQNNINLETMQYEKTYNYGSGYQTVTNKGQTSTVQAGGNINATAGNSISVTGGNINANNDVTLKATNDVSINSLEMNSDYNFNLNNGYNKGQTVRNLGSTINANNIIVDANTLNVKSSNLNANETIGLNAVENVNILATNDLTYQDTQTSSKGFLSKKTQRDMVYKETVNSSELNANDIVINANNNVNLEASKLKADENIIVNAKDGDVNILAKIYREGELHQTSKSSWGGLKKSLDISSTDALKLNSALLETQANNVVITSGKDINILASEINSGNLLLADAKNNLNILSDEEILKQEEIHKKTSFSPSFSGNMLVLAQEKTISDKNATTTQISSNLSGKEVVLQAQNEMNLIGSNIIGKDVILKANDINLLSATQSASNEHSESTKKIGIEVTLNTKEASIFAGGITNKDEINKGNTTQLASNILGDNVTLISTDSTNVLASNILANNDLIIAGGKNINILSGEATDYKDEIHTYLKAGVSLGVKQNVTDGVKNITNTTKNIANSDNAANAVFGGLKLIDTVSNTLSNPVSIGLNAVAISNKSTSSTTNQGVESSNIYVGNNALFDAGEDINIKGSNVYVKNEFDIYAKNLNIEASAEKSNIKTTDKNMDLSVGLYGTNAGKVDVSLAQEKQTAQSTNYVNSNIQAGNLNLNVSNDVKIEGANIKAKDVLANIGNNLTLASLQNNSNSKRSNQSLSVGTSGSLGVGTGKNESQRDWVDNQTTFIGTNSMKVNVGGTTTIKGAVLANADYVNGKLVDNNNLKLNTTNLITQNIYDKNDSNSYNLSLGVSKTQKETQGKMELGLSDSLKEQINYATIGQGEITTNSDITNVNRDVNKSQVVTKDESNNLNIYLSNTSIDKALNPNQTVAKWTQDWKDMGLDRKSTRLNSSH